MFLSNSNQVFKLSAANNDDIRDYLADAVELIPSELPNGYNPVQLDCDSPVLHSFTGNDDRSLKIYYISDIHIEHQILPFVLENSLLNGQFDADTIVRSLIKQKVERMLHKADIRSILLVGGDVSSDFTLSSIFYNELSSQWKGLIISVLGNHELWDTDFSDSFDSRKKVPRTVDEIVSDYSVMMKDNRIALLENELFVTHKYATRRRISQAELLQMSEQELSEFLSQCSFIVLGGIGYSGLNPIYNSKAGLYRNTISSFDEEMRRTNAFKIIYEKVSRSAFDRRVIVLTHNPVYDWTSTPCNSNWIYVNGHTHINSINKSKEGPFILSDNQVGYKPKDWNLNSFIIDKLWYDPFEMYSDGIYPINSEQYIDFNTGRGIQVNGVNRLDKIVMLKRNRIYMFVMQTPKGLNLIMGGRTKKLPNANIEYYYDNMTKFACCINDIISPYYKAMLSLSAEVRMIGGDGKIHGCIVDINNYSHVYVNPFDGKITPYWATDRSSRLCYDTIQQLFDERSPSLLRKFNRYSETHNLPIMSSTMMQETNCFAISLSRLSEGLDIYNLSNAVRSMQYVVESDVIRMWSDDVLAGKKMIDDYITE